MELYPCDECGRFVDELHQPIGELIEICTDCELLTRALDRRVTARLFDATQVGRLDRFDSGVIVIDGVILRRVDVLGVEIG
jgi:hypothetical protein